MVVPKFDELFTTFLDYIKDEKEYNINDVVDYLAGVFNISEEERNKRYKQSGNLIFSNKVGWARLYLNKAGFIESPRRGKIKITKKGITIISTNKIIDRDIVEDNFTEENGISIITNEQDDMSTERTPDELFRENYEIIQQKLANELLDYVKNSSPEFFEKLVLDLLLKMGYGGTREDAGKRIGGTKDGGIDGIIQEDRLGFNNIYIQAKKWENKISRPELQKFIGALSDNNAQKGIFITTSDYTNEALETARRKNIVTINGTKLARLMIEFNIGITTKDIYEIKSIDADYFNEFN